MTHTHADSGAGFVEILEWLEAELAKKKEAALLAQKSAQTTKFKNDKQNYQDEYAKNLEDCKKIKIQSLMVMKARENPWQPPPQFVEEQVNVNKEVVNEDVDPDQICIQITGSDMLRATKADYVKYYLFYDGKKCFKNRFRTKTLDTKTYYHRLPSVNLLKGLRENECHFSIKQSGWLRPKVLDAA